MRLGFALAALVLLAAPSQAAGDAKNGQILYGRCAMCHTIAKGGANGLGPNLHGIYGRKAASQAGFPYSAPLKQYGKVWDEATLKPWLTNPQKTVPGTRMVFNGFRNAKDLDDIIAYLKAQK